LADWPDVPSNFSIPDYKKYAQDIDTVSFDAYSYGSGFRWALPVDSIFSNFATFLRPAFVLDNRISAQSNYSESFVVFPTLISAKLNGLNIEQKQIKGAPALINLIPALKAYYHELPASKYGLFTNTIFPNSFARDFGYDFVPNVYAMQLLSLYSIGEMSRIDPQFENLCKNIVETMYYIHNELKRYSTNSLPNYDFWGVGFRPLPGGGVGIQPVDPDCEDGRPRLPSGITYPSKVQWGTENETLPLICKTKNKDNHGNVTWNGEYIYQPDGAASVALIGVMAFERWGDRKYLDMAREALNFLLSYDRNPNYNQQLPFGVLAAARIHNINRKEGHLPIEEFNINKLMGYAFGWTNGPMSLTTTVRPHIKILHDEWGSVPVYGLWGYDETHQGGNSFFMETASQAVSLAPIAKYQPQFASLIGKYLLHVASNSKFFFHDNIQQHYSNEQEAREHEDPQTLAKIGVLSQEYRSLPFEKIRGYGRNTDGTDNTSIKFYASGDSVESNPRWAETALGYYSGAMVGFLASIYLRTDNLEIPLWDLNKTDFQASDPDLTFLLYNPRSEKTTVTIDTQKIKEKYPGRFDSLDPSIIVNVEGKKASLLKLR